MKRILSIVLVLQSLIFTNSLQAQLFSGDPNKPADSTLPKAEFGIKIGANLNSIIGDQWEPASHAGFSGGFWGRIHKQRIGVRFEVLVSTARLTCAKINDSTGNKYYAITDSAGHQGDFRGTYLDIPIVLEITIVKRLLLQLGGQYSNLVTLSNMNDLKGNYKSIFHSGELSALVGLEVNLPKNFSVGARYRMGFTDINNIDVSMLNGTWKTNAIQLFACYKIK